MHNVLALAGRNASVSADGRRSLGNPPDLPTKRAARVLLCLYHEYLVALHGFI
jgi:hypothetical protein